MPHSNLFCAFGRLQGGVPRTFEHAQRESRGKYTFCNVEHLSRWYGVLARVSGWYGVDCRLAGLCISFTASWLNEICYYMPSLLSLDEWQSLPNFAQTKSDNECCGFAKESSWWLVSFVLCFLVFLVLLRLLGERLFIKSVQRSFCTVWPWNDRLWGRLKNWTMNF